MDIKTKALFVDDTSDGGTVVECAACGAHRVVHNEWVDGDDVICPACYRPLCYPPGASW